MINNKKKKILLLLLIFLFFSTIGMHQIFADFGGTAGGKTPTPNNQTPTGTDPSGGTPQMSMFYGYGPVGDCFTSTCSISRSWNGSAYVDTEIYDMFGTRIGDEPDPNKPFLAGTYIGISISEVKSYSSSASYSYSAKRKKFTCKTYDFSQCAYKNDYGLCVPGVIETGSHQEYCGCTSGSPDGWVWESYAGDPSGCAAAAQPYTVNMSAEPSYDIVYKDSNDIETSEPSNDRYNTMGAATQGGCNVDSDTSDRTSSMSCSLEYNRENACINVKNGKISYKLPCKEGEYELEQGIGENGKKYWKLFIPLNANSEKGFTIYLNSKGTQTGAICQDIINNHNDYRELLVDVNNRELSKNKTQAKKQVAKGCKYKMKIEIPVVQRFYNELENGKNFKGFNFYYKPIDIENPFPNGLTNTSIWYDWNESKVKDPKISDSYKEITYIGFTSGNENLIRQYNKMQENEYTNWQKMNVNGQSSYINKNENIIDRRVDKDSFYALGCGPINSTSDVNNVFYQKECDIS